MPKLNVQVPHELGAPQAAERLRNALAEALPSAGDKVTDLRAEWRVHQCDFQCRVMGLAVRGRVVVTEITAEVAADLPLAAWPLLGRIEADAKERLRRILG